MSELTGIREEKSSHLVSENVGFAKTAQAHRNMWFGKRKSKRAGDEEPLTPRWPHGQLWYEAAAVLRQITEGQSY